MVEWISRHFDHKHMMCTFNDDFLWIFVGYCSRAEAPPARHGTARGTARGTRHGTRAGSARENPN